MLPIGFSVGESVQYRTKRFEHRSRKLAACDLPHRETSTRKELERLEDVILGRVGGGILVLMKFIDSEALDRCTVLSLG